MSKDSLDLIEKEIYQLIKSISVDLKLEKKIDEKQFETLLHHLDTYKYLIRDQNVLCRSFAGKIFYLFSTMVLQAKYVRYDERLMDLIFQLRSSLLCVFDESQFDT
ncbi:hypothetical protein AZ66_05105 [Paenibacillus sp. E194]|nr:hypothetical protein AZ66_05105 [Paenibacillus sp. E194]